MLFRSIHRTGPFKFRRVASAARGLRAAARANACHRRRRRAHSLVVMLPFSVALWRRRDWPAGSVARVRGARRTNHQHQSRVETTQHRMRDQNTDCRCFLLSASTKIRSHERSSMKRIRARPKPPRQVARASNCGTPQSRRRRRR